MKRVRNRLTMETVAAIAAVLLFAGFARADKVTLANGDVLMGKVVEQDDKVVVIEHDVLGRLEIPVDSVTAVTIDTPEGLKQEEPIQEAPAEAEEAKKEIDYWDLSLDLSVNSTTGNTEEQSLRFGLDAARRTDRTRLTIDFSFYWKASDASTTDNKATLGVRNDWLLPESKWFVFALGRADYDQFESWKYRTNIQAGPGYHLIEEEDLKLDLLGGLGVRKEFESLNDDPKAEGILAVDVTWDPTARQRVTFNTSYFPTTDLDDFRMRTQAQWRYALDQEFALSLVIGLLHEYQAIVDPGDERNDLRLWIGLHFGF